MLSIRRCLIGAMILLAPALGAAASADLGYVGRVNHVLDAETLRMTYKGGQIRVKLAGAVTGDALPATETLRKLVLGKQVRVEAIRWDDGYLIGRVFLDGRNVCSEVLPESLAKQAQTQTDNRSRTDEL